jgi:hypothetical protein
VALGTDADARWLCRLTALTPSVVCCCVYPCAGCDSARGLFERCVLLPVQPAYYSLHVGRREGARSCCCLDPLCAADIWSCSLLCCATGLDESPSGSALAVVVLVLGLLCCLLLAAILTWSRQASLHEACRADVFPHDRVGCR